MLIIASLISILRMLLLSDVPHATCTVRPPMLSLSWWLPSVSCLSI